MSDAHIVEKFFESSNKIRSNKDFTDDQWQFLNATSDGGSITDTVYFDTLSLRTQLVDWESAYLVLPLDMYNGSGAGTAYPDVPLQGANNELALKGSVLSLINSVVVNTGSGQNLVNDTQLHLINNLKLLLDQSTNWVTTEGPQLCYAKDTANSPLRASNAGVSLRNEYMLQQSTFGQVAGHMYFPAVIPLRHLHSVFKEMGMSINTHFQMNFGLNFMARSVCTAAAGASPANYIKDFVPFTVGTTTVYPTINIGYNGLPTPRLYYRNLKLSPEQSQRLATTMSGGFKKHIHFNVTDISPITPTDRNQGNGVNSVSVQKTVSPSSVQPQRLFVLPFQTGALTSASYPAPWICTGYLRDTQVKVNNESYFKNPLANDYEHFQEVLRSMPGAGIDSQEGNQLSYYDFAGDHVITGATYRIHVFDIDRLKDRLRSPNDAVSIEFSTTKYSPGVYNTTSTTNNDFIYLVEREQQIVIDYSTSNVEYTLGIQRN